MSSAHGGWWLRGMVLVLVVVPLGAADAPKGSSGPPPAPKKPVTDVYHGVKVVDDYRWLEDVDDPAVQEWVAKQNEHAKEFVEELPSLKKIRNRFRQMYKDYPETFEKVQYENGVLLALRDDNLVVLKDEKTSEPLRTLVDVEKVFPGKAAKVDFYALSEDGKLAAVSLSVDGLEEGTLHVYETATGKKLDDEIPLVNTAVGGNACWNPDGTGFYYTRHPRARPDGKPLADRYAHEELWFHQLGRPVTEDTYVCGRQFPRLVRHAVDVSRDGKYVLIGATTGWGSEECSFWLKGPAGKLETLAAFGDQVTGATYGPDQKSLILHSYKDAKRGRLLMVPLAEPVLARARVLVPESDHVVYSFLVTDKLIYLLDRKDGSERLRVFDSSGKEHVSVTVPPHAAVDELTHLKGDAILYKVDTFREPPAWYRYDPDGKHERLPLTGKVPVRFDDLEVQREWATSRDGTKVPLTILCSKKVKRDKQRPVLLTGYGGYANHERPSYLVQRRMWLDLGGVWAIAHLRGDGELGDDWHKGARRTTKQNAYDDFIACAEYLIGEQYTRPGLIAIRGGSNAGQLVVTVLTQRPDLFGAVVADCGVYDMLRQEQHPSGLHDSAEDGSVADEAQFKALHAYSPFHRVKDGTNYPPVWFRTGANDRRVNPVQTWKMAARLQASGMKNPVLLSIYPNEGHQFTTSGAEEMAFLLAQLGVAYK